MKYLEDLMEKKCIHKISESRNDEPKMMIVILQNKFWKKKIIKKMSNRIIPFLIMGNHDNLVYDNHNNIQYIMKCILYIFVINIDIYTS